MERVRYNLKRREGEEEGKGRSVGCRRGCGVIIPVACSHPPQLPSKLHLSLSLSLSLFSLIHTTTPTPTPTPQILRDSRHASQCPPRHTPDPLTPVCQVPPTSLKQGIWLHSECNREAMWDRRSARSVPGITREISKTEIESTRRKEKKKTRSSHYHTITLTQSSSTTPPILLWLTPSFHLPIPCPA